MKNCCTCKTEKLLTEFSKGLSNKDGLNKQCKLCAKKRGAKYFSENKAIIKERNRAYMKEYLHSYYTKNANTIKETSRKRYEKNKPGIMEKAKVYVREKRATNLDYKILCVLRSRLCNVVAREYKSQKTKDLLGCNIAEFKNHISKKFTDGMSWDNYGRYGWHIDHIIPCAKFDLKNIEDQKQCFHYTNLQPMWAKDNHSKSDKILTPIQTQLLV